MKSDKILFSLIVPVYNTKVDYLSKCLDSLLNQNFNNYEIIVVDDCSTNLDTIYFLDNLKKSEKITVIKNKKNIGLGPSRNIGQKNAQGQWIWFIDSDDWINEESLCVIEKYVKEELDVLYLSHACMYKNYSSINRFITKDPYMTSWSKIINKKFMDDNNIMHADCRLNNEDEYFNMLIKSYDRREKSLIELPMTFYFYNKMNNESITNSNTYTSEQINRNLYEYLLIIKKMLMKRERCCVDGLKIYLYFYCYRFDTFSKINYFKYFFKMLRWLKLYPPLFKFRKILGINIFKQIYYIAQYIPIINLINILFLKTFVYIKSIFKTKNK